MGGINGQAWGPEEVTACITYRLPYMVHGKPASVTSGLTKTAVCNSIIGVPFMERAGMVYSAAERIVTSSVFGLSFPVQYERPAQLEEPPAHRAWRQAAVFLDAPPVIPEGTLE